MPAPLVGRTEELALLDGALAELTRGEWKAVELVGEPGIGKTRLLAELAARASRREQLVLSGFASELEGDLPFWVFVNALDDYVRSLDPRLLDLLDPDVRAGLGNVFPSMSSLGHQDEAVQGERYRTHRAVRELLERLTATRPLVLILDDVFAELDAGRRARLAELVGGYEQVIVTAAVEEDVPSALRARTVRVESGTILEASDV